jgi:predicted phage-related endonuclease
MTTQLRKIQKPPHGSLEWLQRRHRDHLGRCVLGASDAPAMLNQSPFTTRADLFHSKRTTPRITESSAAMQVGNILEPALVSELGRRLGVQMRTPEEMYQRDRFIVSLDALADDTQMIVGEVKTTRRHRISDIGDLPPDYFWQCWAQMLTLDAPVWLIVLDKDMSISTHEIPRNEEALDRLRIESEKFCHAVDTNMNDELWLLKDEMSAEQIAAMYQPPKPVEQAITDEQYAWIKELADARDLKRQAEQIEKAAKDHIARFMLDSEIATHNGTKVLTWREQAGRASLDVARLREAHPELIAEFTSQGSPSRVMRLSNTKGNQ